MSQELPMTILSFTEIYDALITMTTYRDLTALKAPRPVLKSLRRTRQHPGSLASVSKVCVMPSTCQVLDTLDSLSRWLSNVGQSFTDFPLLFLHFLTFLTLSAFPFLKLTLPSIEYHFQKSWRKEKLQIN